MQIEGPEVVKYLSGRNTVRDGRLVSFAVQDMVTKPVVKLVFEVSKQGSIRTVKLELRDVLEFSYSYTSIDAPFIECLKCLWTDEGDFYLSLDPYDERERFISDQDNDCFRSKSVNLLTDEAPTD
ncbi:MAG: hypothetical protein ACREEB_04985 [Caulobacteraceae bacterium]